ncbi:MAG: ATP-binding protein [Elusimicrobiota bacterium]
MINSYVHRIVDIELDELLPQLPAVALEGPKGVGKTETARRRANTVYALDDPVQNELIKADPSQLCDGEKPILIDEWQRVPESWDIIRRAVDRDSSPNQFLLTGSATPSSRSTHSGAGRIVTLRLRPMSLMERNLEETAVSLKKLLTEKKTKITGQTKIGLKDYVHELFLSGFPGLRQYSGRALREQLKSYIERIVDTDFQQMGRKVRKPQTLKRWMASYAAATSTTASYETIRDAATPGRGNKPPKTTTRPYREILEQLWIMEQIPAWVPSRNQFSRLSKPPKHQLADPALAIQLLGINEEALLKGEEPTLPIPRDGTLLGHLFESLVTQTIRVYAQASEAEVKHFRTMGGRHEVDLIIERSDQKIIAVEVKLGRTVENSDIKHLLWLKKKMKNNLLDMALVHTGPQAYRRKDGVAVIPASLLSV